MLIIHPTIEEKLKNKHEIDNPRHVVSSLEKNLIKNDGKDYIPTEWFVAKHGGQYYKVVFIRKGADIILKTAYVTKPKYIQMYKDHQIKGFDIAPLKAEMTKLLKGK